MDFITFFSYYRTWPAPTSAMTTRSTSLETQPWRPLERTTRWTSSKWGPLRRLNRTFKFQNASFQMFHAISFPHFHENISNVVRLLITYVVKNKPYLFRKLFCNHNYHFLFDIIIIFLSAASFVSKTTNLAIACLLA